MINLFFTRSYWKKIAVYLVFATGSLWICTFFFLQNLYV